MDEGPCKQFDTVIFDLDGVITGEDTYWKAAALTVYEYFYDDLELNSQFCYENVDAITERVFSYQKTIVTLKSLGINSNWDLAYAVIMTTDILKSEGLEEDDIFSGVADFLEDKNVLSPELLDILAQEYEELFHYPDGYAKKGGEFYQEIVRKFQHWYLGDIGYQASYPGVEFIPKGEIGLLDSEEPLLGMKTTEDLLKTLKQRGYHLGIGSGRPNAELHRPLENWNLLSLFDEDKISGYDDVLLWQEILKKETGTEEKLVKPHPFQFIKAAVGSTFTEKNLQTPPDLSRTLVVGDALCDFLAAKAAGCKFCAVLTGVDGKDARLFFENLGADYILEDAADLPEILL